MSVFKKIDANDVNIIPFNVHKQYTATNLNYSGSSCGLGINILAAKYYSHSFGDPLKGKHISDEPKNPNGSYKGIIYDSINHLYYQRTTNPAENFGGNLPEREIRNLEDTAHVISIPSTLFDIQIETGSVEFTDNYIESLAIDRERFIESGSTEYRTPVLLGSRYMFETSASQYVDGIIYPGIGALGETIERARPSSPPQHKVVTGSGYVGTGSMLFKVSAVDGTENVGNGIKVRDQSLFDGTQNSDWWPHPNATNAKHGMPAYSVTMWVKPPDWNDMPNKVTGAPGVSHIISRDKNAYFELNMITSSYNIDNGKGLVPLQMFFGATANKGTSGSQYEELPPWGHSAAKTTLRIYRPDPNETSGFKYIKKVGYATASNDPSGWSNQTTRAVTSSIQYNRHMYIGASASRAVGALNNNPTSRTLYGAFTGSIDDIRFYESTLTDAQVSNLAYNPKMDLRRTPPVTASFNLKDDGYGNIIDTIIPSHSFADNKKLVGYYGFNDLYTINNRISSSSDDTLHRGFGATKIKDYSNNLNHAESDKVRFTPGIAIMQQSGSIRTAESINFYQTDVNTGIRATFNNSGSIRIPHIPDLNLDNEEGFTISFWIKIPKNQIPGTNTLTGSGALYPTTGIGGQAGGTSFPCSNVSSGSTAGRDYVTLITKSGLSYRREKNAATGEPITRIIQGREAENTFPYHIELKNTSLEKDNKPFAPGNGCPLGADLNTIVVRRKGKRQSTFLESKSSLTPLIENHVVIRKFDNVLEIWINGKLDKRGVDNTDCTDNLSDVFIGDSGRSWVTGSSKIKNIEHSFVPPHNPFSGSIDELRFYRKSISEDNILSLYDNNLDSGTAYQDNNVGNVFYQQGILTLTNNRLQKYFSGSLHDGTAVVGNSGSMWDGNGKSIFSNQFNLKFRNTRQIFEQTIRCHAKASDFNLSTNPTLRKKTVGDCEEILSVQELADIAKLPEFNPYVTTIGLYDEFGQLLAIAKLAKPIPKLKNVDMTFVVRFDR